MTGISRVLLESTIRIPKGDDVNTAVAVPRVLAIVFLTLLAACGSVSPTSDSSGPSETGTAECVQGNDWPLFDEQNNAGARVANTTGDIDVDGELDQVSVFVEATGSGNTAWVRVEFDNGGVVTGPWLGEVFEPPPQARIQIADLTGADRPGNTNEIIFEVGASTADGGWSVVAVQDCSVRSTTLEGDPFVFGTGRSDGIATIAGCPFVSSDETAVRFTTHARNFAGGEWTRQDFQLEGTVWTLLESRLFSDFPVGDGSIYFPVGPTLESCQPATIPPEG